MKTIELQAYVVMTRSEEDFCKELGKRVAEFRKEQGMTQQQLADVLGSKQYKIASYESGRYRVPVALLPALAAALSVSVEDLLGVPGKERARRGPAPKIRKQLDMIERLPRNRQQFVSQVLDQLLTAEKTS